MDAGEGDKSMRRLGMAWRALQAVALAIGLLWPAGQAAAQQLPEAAVMVQIEAPTEVRAYEPFSVTLRAVNVGEVAPKWSLSLSLPTAPEVDLIEPVPFSASASHARVFSPGAEITNIRYNRRLPAEYPLVEWYSEQPWAPGTERKLVARVRAPGGGSVVLLARVAVRDAGNRLYSYPSTGAEDQQGFPNLQRRVLVTAAPAAPPPTAAVLPAAGSTPTADPVPTAPPAATAAPAPTAEKAAAAVAPTPVRTSNVAGTSSTSSDSPALLLMAAVVIAAGIIAAAIIVTRRSQPAPSGLALDRAFATADRAGPPATWRPASWPPSVPPPAMPASPPPRIARPLSWPPQLESPTVPAPPGWGTPPVTGPGAGGSLGLPVGYQIVGQPKRGGMAIVYKAYQLALDRYVALKMLSPEFSSDPEFLRRFHDEAKRTAGLEHPHIVPIYDIGQVGGSLFIAMRWIDGQSLQELLAHEGPLPPRRTLAIAAQVAEALDYAHARGVIHRDIKPANIMIEAGDRVTLTDFGIARRLDGTQYTQAGMIIGTPAYMSPEQAAGQPADARSDIYALGLVVYEMLTGRLPFEAPEPLAVASMHRSTQPPPPTAFNRTLPRSLGLVVLRALAKQPHERYASGREFVAALRRALGEAP